jgi:hypothetical protein
MWEIITKFQPQNLNWKTQKTEINGNIILKWILEEYHTDRIQLTQEKAWYRNLMNTLNFWVMHPVARVPIKHFFADLRLQQYL